MHAYIDHSKCKVYEKCNYVYSLWTENPLFQYYSYLMETVSDPDSLSEKLEAQKLLSTHQLKIVFIAPMDYMKLLYIFQHVCNMSLDELYTFFGVLTESDNYKHIGDKLTKGMFIHIYIARYSLHNIIIICGWASENGPSGHTKFDHTFHFCCIITNDLLKLCKWNFYHQLTVS